MRKKTCDLYLNKKIYDRESIVSAMHDYSAICAIELTESLDYYCCVIKSYNEEPELIKKEFVNYVIGLGVKSKRCFRL